MRNLGIVVFGASIFDHWPSLNNSRFANSAHEFQNFITDKGLIGESNIQLLNLFDRKDSPSDLTDEIIQFIDSTKFDDLVLYYCGHGFLTDDRKSYLVCLRSTRERSRASSALKVRDLALDLEQYLFGKRVFIILDACFAGEAIKEFMDAGIAPLIEKSLIECFPRTGVAVLAATEGRDVALAGNAGQLTVFTGALVETLTVGIESQSKKPNLSWRDVLNNVRVTTRERLGQKAPRPVIATREAEGDITTMPFFVNRAFKISQSSHDAAPIEFDRFDIALPGPSGRKRLLGRHPFAVAVMLTVFAFVLGIAATVGLLMKHPELMPIDREKALQAGPAEPAGRDQAQAAPPEQAGDWGVCKDESIAADTAIEACSRIISAGRVKGRDLAIAHYNRAISYRQKVDNDRAIVDYDAAIRIDPDYARAFNNRGNVWKDKGDQDRAIADYNEAIRLDPKFSLAYANRGDVWDDKGDSDRAIADLTQAIQFDPKYSRAYNVRGVVWKKKGDLDRAIADFTEAIRNDPKSAIAYTNRADARDDKGDQDGAIADLTEAIRVNPNYARAYNIRAVIYKDRKQFDRAIADYTEAVRVDPKYALAYTNRGNLYKERGDQDRAIADYTEAIRINPKSDINYLRRSEALLKKGDKIAALRDADTAVSLDPNDAANYANRAAVMRALNQANDAIADLRKGLKLNPNATRKRELEAALRALGAAP